VTTKEDIDIFQSALVPKHEILDEEEKRKFIEKYGVSEKQIPKIKSTDPAVKILGAKKGDLIRIIRKSQTAGEYIYFRIVV